MNRFFCLIIIILSFSMADQKYKEPQFALIEKTDNIEIRQYNECVVAKTSIPLNDTEEDNNMFMVLASYIFGENEKKQNIPMTAPVTTFKNNNSYDMIFYMLDADNIEDLPMPSGQDIVFEKLNLGKCAVVNFSWFTNKSKIEKYKLILEKFIEENKYEKLSPFMVNRYDPPWRLPFLRRNEILVQIK